MPRTLTTRLPLGVQGVLVEHRGGPTVVVSDLLVELDARAVTDRLMRRRCMATKAAVPAPREVSLP